MSLIKKEATATQEVAGRLATKLAQESGQIKEEVFLEDDKGRRVSAKSLLGVLSLGIKPGNKFEICVSENRENTEETIKYLLSILGGVG